jgi:hypothetical protein
VDSLSTPSIYPPPHLTILSIRIIEKDGYKICAIDYNFDNHFYCVIISPKRCLMAGYICANLIKFH